MDHHIAMGQDNMAHGGRCDTTPSQQTYISWESLEREHPFPANFPHGIHAVLFVDDVHITQWELVNDQAWLFRKIHLTSGEPLEEYVSAVRGTADNPMTLAEVEEKARELIVPVTGEEMGSQLIERFMRIEELTDVRDLRPLLLAVRSL